MFSTYLRLFQDGSLKFESSEGKMVLAGMQARCQGAISHLVDVLRITNLDAPVLLDEAFTRFDLGSHIRAVLSRVENPERIGLQMKDGVCLYGVPEHFEILIEHLLNNALRYSPPRSPVQLLAEEQPHGIGFSVENRGFGVSQEHVDKIFEAYFRVKEAAGVTERGSGPGLTSCARIAALHITWKTVERDPV